MLLQIATAARSNPHRRKLTGVHGADRDISGSRPRDSQLGRQLSRQRLRSRAAAIGRR